MAAAHGAGAAAAVCNVADASHAGTAARHALGTHLARACSSSSRPREGAAPAPVPTQPTAAPAPRLTRPPLLKLTPTPPSATHAPSRAALRGHYPESSMRSARPGYPKDTGQQPVLYSAGLRAAELPRGLPRSSAARPRELRAAVRLRKLLRTRLRGASHPPSLA